jgi:hypothetical protein
MPKCQIRNWSHVVGVGRLWRVVGGVEQKVWVEVVVVLLAREEEVVVVALLEVEVEREDHLVVDVVVVVVVANDAGVMGVVEMEVELAVVEAVKEVEVVPLPLPLAVLVLQAPRPISYPWSHPLLVDDTIEACQVEEPQTDSIVRPNTRICADRPARSMVVAAVAIEVVASVANLPTLLYYSNTHSWPLRPPPLPLAFAPV